MPAESPAAPEMAAVADVSAVDKAAAGESAPNVFGRWAAAVEHFFEARYYTIGHFVGYRPCASLGITLIIVLACAAGFSQYRAESRADKLWIPQGTRAQADEQAYTEHFPPGARFVNILLETKSSNILDKASLEAAIGLHEKIEAVSFESKNLTEVCLKMPGDGHPCFIKSVLGTWMYDDNTLSMDSDPLATLNSAGYSEANLRRMLGAPTIDASGKVVQAKALSITYLNKYDRVLNKGDYEDLVGEGWEEQLLDMLGCNDPECSGKKCKCSYKSDYFSVYAIATRSFGDAFGGVITGDVGLINAAFVIIIAYLILNLGGLCHKVNSRVLLAFGCVLCIVAAGFSGYGLAMWFKFPYTPVHSILPFVILGIGVDDSFVIMNCLDRTDPTLSVTERIAKALSHAGVSCMVTSLTDFVAFALSVSSSLPALGSFCITAALCILLLFIFQLLMFTAFATFDTRRVVANRIDCCFCLPRGCFCCPTVPKEQADRAIEEGKRDPNQMCCSMTAHKGGIIGRVLEHKLGPIIVKKPVAVFIILAFMGWCGACISQVLLLAVEDTQRRFLPDNSYVLATLEKNDVYFASLGTKVDLMTMPGDYFAAQKALIGVRAALDDNPYMNPTTGDSYVNWAEQFKAACAAKWVPGVTALDAEGYVTDRAQYYAGLQTWLRGPGARYASDVVWVDAADPQQGIKVSRMSCEIASVTKAINGKVIPDADAAVAAMESVRNLCDAQSGLPGGKCIPYTQDFLSWETFKIIKVELFSNVALCLAAVLVITLVTIAHPLTAGLIFICVVMTIVDILGCMHMWGIAIDSVSVIQLVIAVGLSVDYSAHVGHNFMTQVGTREQRVLATLGDIGSAVMSGGVSTFLGVLLLALSKSYVFRVLFQSFFLTVILGLAHGMILLPAILSLIGPKSFHSGRKA